MITVDGAKAAREVLWQVPDTLYPAVYVGPNSDRL
jgi:hypothetical protein